MIKQARQFIMESLPDWLFFAVINAECMIKGRDVRIGKSAANPDLYLVKCGREEVHLARRGRWRRFAKGVAPQAANLAKTYCLANFPLHKGDVIIDCGANIGELGLWAAAAGADYIACEPEAREADCIDLNVYRGQPRTIRKGLWKEDGTLTFYSKPDSADSSLIEIREYDRKTEVAVTTLDTLVNQLGLSRIRLLKLEAEGAEPEVLEGASIALQRIEYVVVECGYERGINCENTFVEVNNILCRNGFVSADANLRRTRFLYRNNRLAG